MLRRRPSPAWIGVALGLVAVGLLFTGNAVAPKIVVWLLAGLLVWAGTRLVVKEVGWPGRRLPNGPAPEGWKLKPGESYDTSVPLTRVPNEPLAELLCSELKAQGIEAFYKRATVVFWGPSMPVEIWVGRSHLDEARKLLAQTNALPAG